MAETREHFQQPAPVGEDARTASITPQGKAINQPLENEARARAVPKAPAAAGTDMTPDPSLEKNGKSGFGMVDGTQHPGDRQHEGGDPSSDGDAQYGASPLRDVRYREDHEVEAGERHHRGIQPGRHFDPSGQTS